MHTKRLLLSGAVLVLSAAAFPAVAERDISGTWRALYHEDFPERVPGPSLVEYYGLPINEAARARGLAWDASILSLPEHQCRPHPADYGSRHSNVRIWAEFHPETQQLVAYRSRREWQAVERTIWMDGRPHPPPNAPHTWQGFSTGEWEGDKLKVTTTHLKHGYVRRNGLPRSDRAMLVEYFYRNGLDHLTIVRIVDDPVYLTEPLVATSDYRLDLELRIDAYPCDIVEEVVGLPPGYVPHHLPGQNPAIDDFATTYGLPLEAVLGGAVTMYPTFLGGEPGALPRVRTIEPVRAAGAVAGAAAEAGALEILPVQGGVYLIAGPTSNAVVQVGADGVLVVDTHGAGGGDALVAAIRTLTDAPIRYVVNTHAHPDHIGGNLEVIAAGQSVAGGNVARAVSDAGQGAKGIAHENVLLRLESLESPPPYRAWPTDFFVERPKDLFFNGEAVRVIHQPAAHTDGDSIVHFRGSDVIATGDVFSTVRYPVIDVEHGGSIDGIIDSLNRLLEIAVPRDRQEGGTMIVPGHGRIADEADVVEYRDMLTIIRDRIRHLIAQGYTLEQVKAERPTLDYDPLYGAAEGERLVEAVYASLAAGGADRGGLTSRDRR